MPRALASGIALALVVVVGLGAVIWLLYARGAEDPPAPSASDVPASTEASQPAPADATAETRPAPGDDLHVVLIDGRYGYVDSSGEVAIDPQWEVAYEFSEGLAAVLVDDGFGYVDPTGRVVIEPRYLTAGPFSQGLADCMDDSERCGYIDKSGSWAIEPRFETAGPFSDGLAAASTGGDWGYIDTSGDWVIEPVYTYCDRFAEGLGPVSSASSGASFVDRSGQIVVQTDADTVWAFSEGLAAAAVGELVGYLDTDGRWVITPQFVMGFEFHDGLAAVLTDMDDYGYVDRAGELAIGPGYAEAWDFRDGVAGVVPEPGKIMLIDTSGRTVWEP